jgi:DNA repair ATPase RecN
MIEPDNLTLRLLRSIDGKLDRVHDDVRDIKVRITSVEEALAGVNRRIDRSESRLDRIERRLELVSG